MKTKIMLLASCFALLALFSGCATILTGKTTTITFKSNSEGKVYQNLTEIGKTNQPIEILKKDIIKLYTIKSNGCPDKQIELPIRFTPIVYLNVLNFNVFASLDYYNGCHMKTDNTINVDFDCKK